MLYVNDAVERKDKVHMLKDMFYMIWSRMSLEVNAKHSKVNDEENGRGISIKR